MKCPLCKLKVEPKIQYLVHVYTTHGVPKEIIYDWIAEYNNSLKK